MSVRRRSGGAARWWWGRRARSTSKNGGASGWPVPERIRPTKVGFWYVLCCVVVGIAATNTGNNALYIVLALMLALLVVSGLVSRHNLRGLVFEVSPPDEIFATLPFHLRVSVRNRSRLLPRWLLVFALSDKSQPLLVPYLPNGGSSRGFMEMILSRRGRHSLPWVHVGSIFPLGFFHKGMRYRVDLEVLVFPELYPAASGAPPVESGDRGEGVVRRAGWGYDLHALRGFRQGDDPRGIHWKQTARTGSMIYTEREAEEGRRLSIVFDNASGELTSEGDEQRFERLVSEAATAAVDYLQQGFEVELLTRDRHIPFGSGRFHRLTLLETLALVGPRPRESRPLVLPGRDGAQLRLAMEAVEEVA